MIDLEAIQKRYWDWYCPPDRNCCPREGDFSLRDNGETKSHFIVRNDVPGMIEEIRRCWEWMEEAEERAVLD